MAGLGVVVLPDTRMGPSRLTSLTPIQCVDADSAPMPVSARTIISANFSSS